MNDLQIRPDLLVDLPNEIREQLRTYRDLILHWNTRFNLTAITDAESVDRRLTGDALRLLPALDQALVSAPEPVRVVDLGTGAGLPGLAIKIARPGLPITLIDATRKKVQFVEHVARELGLRDVRVIHGRAEDIGHMVDYRQQFSIGMARAVASLPTLLELLLPLIVPGGAFLLPKGSDIEGELVEGRRAAHTLGARIESWELLPGVLDEPVTRLVTGAKLASTPDRYPRRAGIPNREPLGRERK